MCPPAGPCRGFVGDCADLQAQFADVAVLPDYPDGLASYTCTAFPNDNNPVDSFIVGLIAVAIAVPVVNFMGGCFEVSNDSEVPEALLTWAGWRKLVFGFAAHRRWHYARDGQPRRYVRWWARSSGESVLETGANLARAAAATATCAEPPWVLEAREAEETEEPATEAGTPRGSVSSTVRSARRLTRYKRAVTCVGLLATYCIWALFTWFIMVCSGCAAAASLHALLTRRPLRPQTYGSLIYRLMGPAAEDSFAKSWGISWGLNCATEWKQVLVEALKCAVVLTVLEWLCLTRNVSWLEDHIDLLSLQALLFKRAALGVWAQTRVLYRHSRRLSD